MTNENQNPFLKDGQSIKSLRTSRFAGGKLTLVQKTTAAAISIIIAALVVSFIVMNNKQNTQASVEYYQPAQQIPTDQNNRTAEPTSNQSTSIQTDNGPQPNDRNNDILAKHDHAMKLVDNEKPEKAAHLFSELSTSDSAVIAANASYQLAVIKLNDNDHIETYRLAHQALNTISLIQDETGQFTNFKTICNLLIAESLGNYTFSLRQDDTGVIQISLAPKKIDLLEQLTSQQKEQLVFSGTQVASAATDNPITESLIDANASASYNVTCNRIPLDDLLLKITSLDCFDVRYENFQSNEHLKKRLVTLCIKGGTIDDVVTNAAGSAGLLASIERSEDESIIHIINPSQYQSVSSHLQLLNRLAKKRWTSFLLTCDSDTYSAAAHIALGLLEKQNNKPLQAVVQFNIVADNYYQSILAPLALLYSAQTKAFIKDYPSAITDLTRLVEQYPSSQFFHQGYLELADIQFRTKDFTQAAKINEKVYSTDNSTEIKTKAAYSAAQCCYQNFDYKNTHKWLSRYFEIAKENNDIHYPKALLTLGLTCSKLNNFDQANQAFMLAMRSDLSAQDYSAAAFGLTNSLVNSDDFSTALGVLDNIDTWQLTPSQAIMMIQTKSRIYHKIGLTDKAIALLIDKIDIITEPNLKAEVALQIAQYLKETGKLQKACRLLAETIAATEDYSLTQSVSFALAEICYLQGNFDQTISTCHKLLDNDLPDEMKQNTLNILAKAYNSKGQYQNAALALLGQIPPQQEKTISFNNNAEQAKLN